MNEEAYQRLGGVEYICKGLNSNLITGLSNKNPDDLNERVKIYGSNEVSYNFMIIMFDDLNTSNLVSRYLNHLFNHGLKCLLNHLKILL